MIVVVFLSYVTHLNSIDIRENSKLYNNDGISPILEKQWNVIVSLLINNLF